MTPVRILSTALCLALAASLGAEVLAKAGSEKVTREEFEAALQEQSAQAGKALGAQERGALLRSMLNQRLMVQEAKRRKLDREPAFKAARDEFERRALTDLLFKQAVAAKAAVSAEQARQFYAQNPGLFDVAELSQILVAAKPGEEAEAKKKAEKLAASLKGSPKSFADKARKLSDDGLSKERGGDLGALRHGMLLPELDAAVFNAKAPAIVGPVQTRFGFHILQVRSLKRLSWEQAGEGLRQELERQRSLQLQQELLEDLAEKDKVKILVEEDKL